MNTRTKKLEEDKAAQIKKLQAQMDEIMALKQQMKSSLSTIPREVLKQLGDAIQAYLKNQ